MNIYITECKKTNIMKKYKMVQISEEHHLKLKEYCETHDKKMSKVLERIIDTNFSVIKLKVDTNKNENTLRV